MLERTKIVEVYHINSNFCFLLLINYVAWIYSSILCSLYNLMHSCLKCGNLRILTSKVTCGENSVFLEICEILFAKLLPFLIRSAYAISEGSFILFFVTSNFNYNCANVNYQSFLYCFLKYRSTAVIDFLSHTYFYI